MVCTTGQASAALASHPNMARPRTAAQLVGRTSFCVAVWALCGLTRLGLLLCCQPGHGDLVLPTLAHTAGAVGAHAVVRPQGAVTVDVDLSRKATATGNQGSVRRQRPSASARHHAAAAVGHQLIEPVTSCVVQLFVVRPKCSQVAHSQLRMGSYYYSLSRPLSVPLMLCGAVHQQLPAADSRVQTLPAPSPSP